MAVYGDGDVRVCFSGGYTWTFNPACLSAEDDTIVDLDPHQKTDSYSNNSYVEVLQVCCYRPLAITSLINNRIAGSRINRGPFEVGFKGWDWSMGSIQDPWYAGFHPRTARTRAKRAFSSSNFKSWILNILNILDLKS